MPMTCSLEDVMFSESRDACRKLSFVPAEKDDTTPEEPGWKICHQGF